MTRQLARQLARETLLSEGMNSLYVTGYMSATHDILFMLFRNNDDLIDDYLYWLDSMQRA